MPTSPTDVQTGTAALPSLTFVESTVCEAVAIAKSRIGYLARIELTRFTEPVGLNSGFIELLSEHRTDSGQPSSLCFECSNLPRAYQSKARAGLADCLLARQS
jgi:hypothetical protein